MKSTTELLDALRERLQLPSDYALQDVLGVTKQQISRYRKGDDFLSEETAIKAADALGIERGLVLAWVAGERARTPSARDAWRITAARLGGAALVAILAYLGAAPLADFSPFQLVDQATAAPTLYIMSNIAIAIFLIAINLLPFLPREQ